MNDTHNILQRGSVVTYPDSNTRSAGVVEDYHHGQCLVNGLWHFADECEVIDQTMPSSAIDALILAVAS